MKCKKHPSRGAKIISGNFVCKKCNTVLGPVPKKFDLGKPKDKKDA